MQNTCLLRNNLFITIYEVIIISVLKWNSSYAYGERSGGKSNKKLKLKKNAIRKIE
jgi:hypothetical protein